MKKNYQNHWLHDIHGHLYDKLMALSLPRYNAINKTTGDNSKTKSACKFLMRITVENIRKFAR